MRAVVIGGGVAGLVAARRLVLGGADVVLLEATDALGGRVVPVQVGGIQVDGGAESFATRGGTVRALLDAIGLGGDVVDPVGSAWVALADRTVPLPAGGLLGIPSSPLADDVRRVIDTAGALRAYGDRLLPVLKVGQYQRLGPLVRGRMGVRVLDRLVSPVVQTVYGADPDDVPIDLIAPGLNAALTQVGTLSGAVLRLRTAAPPGSAAQGLVGGVHRLVTVLAEALHRAGVELRTATPVLAVRVEETGFTVITEEEALTADRVVIAADGAAALALLRDIVPVFAELPMPAPAVTRTVLVRIDDERLDAAPRGTGVLRAAAQADISATALTHLTAKWLWLAARTGAGHHLLRLAYRGAGDVADATVRSDSGALMGLDGLSFSARTDVVWRDTAPPLAPETIRIRQALTAIVLPPGLSVAGAWTAGTGLASVVGSAERAAEPYAT